MVSVLTFTKLKPQHADIPKPVPEVNEAKEYIDFQVSDEKYQQLKEQIY